MTENHATIPIKEEMAMRGRIIVRTSVIGIIVNILLAAFKAAVGITANSIAVLLDAVNNLSDALSSVITVVGAKLAGRKPDKEHPFGHGRIEYLSAMIIAAIVFYAGLTSLWESGKKIIEPEAADYSALSLVIIAVAVIVKIVLGRYFKRQGQAAESGALEASGADALFEQCVLRTVNNGLPHSWVTAPSGSAEGLGFVFWDCDFVSDCPAGSVYLGRPWRPTGKTAVVDCRLGAHIAPEGFAGWNDRTDTALAGFAEAGSTGAGAGERPGWVQALSAAEAAVLLRTARQKCRMETTERITE